MFVRELHGLDARDAARRLGRRPQLAWLDGEGSTLADARYSFVASDPVDIWAATLNDAAPFAKLDDFAAEAVRDNSPEHPELPRAVVPRYIGYLAYDAHFCSHQRRLPRRHERVACFARYDACAVFDHERGRAFVAGDDAAACERLVQRLAAREATLHAQAGAVVAGDAALHARAIATALEHIGRGDIYQVNLARSFVASYAGDALLLALAMRDASPVPLGFYFDDGEQAVIARTMERFLRFDRASRDLITRPIKGTLARSGDDRAEASALTRDPKERAEHAMIIDLMRNDLSRVAELGSVRVSDVMAVERYAKLSHLVSTVSCRVRPELTLSAIAAATFPPGSVTGTPKLRAIEIIEALEQEARGVYTGALGYVDRAGGLSLAVAIRTACVREGQARYFAGGGIVEASRIEHEVAETELKAQVFYDALRALGARAAGQDQDQDQEQAGDENVALSGLPFLR